MKHNWRTYSIGHQNWFKRFCFIAYGEDLWTNNCDFKHTHFLELQIKTIKVFDLTCASCPQEHVKQLTASKLQQLHNKQCELKLDVTGVLEDEKRWLETMVVKLHALKDNAIGREFHSEPVDKYEEERGPPPDKETSTADPLIAEEALPTELVGETEESDSRSVATIVPSSEESDTTLLTPPEVSIQVSTISEVVSETKDEAYPVSEADTNDIIITRVNSFCNPLFDPLVVCYLCRGYYSRYRSSLRDMEIVLLQRGESGNWL